MSHKFKSEDFDDAIRSIDALAKFEPDLGDYFIRNSDKYKEACQYLHKDMLEQKLIVVDMDSLPTAEELHPMQLTHNELLIGLQADNMSFKRMLSVTRYTPEEGGGDQMIIVPLISSQTKHAWRPVGLVVYVRDLDDVNELQMMGQPFPGTIPGAKKQQQLTNIVLDAMNTIATAMNSGLMRTKEKVPSKLKQDRTNPDVKLRPFTLMGYK